MCIAEIYKLPCYNSTASIGTHIGHGHVENNMDIDSDVGQHPDDDKEAEPDDVPLLCVTCGGR